MSELTLRRLAQRVAAHHDREAAIVLGDALMEAGRDRIATGRVRRARFRVLVFPSSRNSEAAFAAVLTREERDHVRAVRERVLASPVTSLSFYVPAREVLFNVDNYARRPTEEAWSSIFAMWVTSRRDTFAAMRNARILPRTIRAGDLVWDTRVGVWRESELPYILDVERVPRRRKRPQRTYLFDVWRLDTPATETSNERMPVYGPSV